MPQPEPSRADGGLGYLLMTAAHAWRTSLGRRLVPLGITPAQFFVIMAVHHRTRTKRSPLNQRQIAEKTGMDVNVVSQVIRALEHRALLVRAPHPDDGRALTVDLTAAGSTLAAASSLIARRMNDQFFTDTDQSALAAQLGQLREPIQREETTDAEDLHDRTQGTVLARGKRDLRVRPAHRDAAVRRRHAPRVLPR